MRLVMVFSHLRHIGKLQYSHRESQKLLQKRGLVRSTFKETLSMSNSIVFLFGVGDICLKYLQSIPYRMCHQLMREILYDDFARTIKDNSKWALHIFIHRLNDKRIIISPSKESLLISKHFWCKLFEIEYQIDIDINLKKYSITSK